MPSSPSGLKLTTGDPALCALAGCNKTAEVLCRRCMSTPAIGTAVPLLAEIAYCSEGHLEQDAAQHEEMCTCRRWLRYVGRLGELHYLLFSIDCKEKSFQALHYANSSKDGTALDIVYGDMQPWEPFCSFDVDKDVELCALYNKHCDYAMALGAGLMAYLNMNNEMRVKERHSLVDSRKIVRICYGSGEAQNNENMRLSVFFLAPPFFAPRADPFTEDGIILDPSGMQFYFKETIDTALEYQSKKGRHAEDDQSRYHEPLGCAFKRHRDQLQKASGPVLDILLNTEARIRASWNIMYNELHLFGGAEGIDNSDDGQWEEFKERIIRLLMNAHRGIRTEIDLINTIDGLQQDKIHEMKRKLVVRENGEGYERMVALLDDIGM
ncbi:uncharacterized protein N0V89_000509 [Didymosphaeria variabile]|uniref:Uncharacterized protein n=1 Tax=Didymosphaeria variabile TaxID=1932322 RepID=A0A9W8XW96_9PLEO|nr:uncharacterized protein N0V89_000509 [Didymosphaeria variabile]KAJ4359950.1 hypothetical protein N0V89_000509 [Didymosphaeria variabile]